MEALVFSHVEKLVKKLVRYPNCREFFENIYVRDNVRLVFCLMGIVSFFVALVLSLYLLCDASL